MSKFSRLLIAIFFLGTFNNIQAQLNTALDSLSYSIGVNIGVNLSKQGLQPNMEILSAAIQDVLSKNDLKIQENECNSFIQSYFQKEFSKKADANKKAGEDFLLANKTQEGVISTPSGLQYKVLKEGTGVKPTTVDKVKVHYHGTTIDGMVFDSSVDRGTPAEFGVTQVIKGWIEGLQLMPTGAKYKFFIPSELAYGPQGPPNIGPNQVLIFDVELLEIVK